MNETESNRHYFEDLLKDEFLRRKKENSNYSLRAFARDLNIQASPLSAILNDKRPITNEMKRRLGLSLGLTPTEIDRLKTFREYNDQGIADRYREIDVEMFEIISHPYYFAILELFKLNDFEDDAKWMATKLNLNTFQVQDAIDRLLRVKLLSKDKEENLSLSDEAKATTSLLPGLTSEARKRYQKEILRESHNAVEQVDLEKRDHTSMTFAINEEDLDEARELTKKYRRDMANLFNKKEEKDSVYHLQISLFPTTKPEGTK